MTRVMCSMTDAQVADHARVLGADSASTGLSADLRGNSLALMW